MDPDFVRNTVWAAASLVGVSVYGSRTHVGRGRFALGLFCGAVFAHLGWVIVHLPLALEHPHWILQPGAASVLFLPLGVMLVAPWRESLSALPLAIAVARLGCLPYSCCYEVPAHALPEIGSLVLLHVLSRRREHETTLIVLSGFGLTRLSCAPLRIPLAAEPFIEPAWVGGLWVVAGVLLRNGLGSAADATTRRADGRQVRIGRRVGGAALVGEVNTTISGLSRRAAPGPRRAAR